MNCRSIFIVLVLVFAGHWCIAQKFTADEIIEELKQEKNDSIQYKKIKSEYWNYIYGNPSNAFYIASYHLEKSLNAGNEKEEMNALNELGIYYDITGNYVASVDHYKESYRLAKKLKNYTQQAHIKNNIGLAYKNKGDYGDAIKHYLQSAALHEKHSDTSDIARIYKNLGDVYYIIEEDEQSVEYFKKAAELFQILGYAQALTYRYECLAKMEEIKDEQEKAIAFYEISAHLNDSLGRLEPAAYTYYNIGNARKKLGDYDGAVNSYEKAMTIFVNIRDENGQSYVVPSLALVEIDKGNYDQANVYLEKAYELALKSGDLKVMLDVYAVYVSLYERQNNPELTMVYKDSMIWIKDSIIVQQRLANETDKEIRYKMHKKKVDDLQQLKDKEIQQLKKQRNKQLLLYGGIGLLIVALLVFIIVRSQGQRKKMGE